MRSFLVLTVIILVGVFGTILTLGFFGVISLPALYMDVVGFSKGINFSTYRSTKLAIEIRHPDKWNIDEKLLDSKISFIARDPETSEVLGTFRIERKEPPKNFDFAEYVNKEVEALAKARSRYLKTDQREIELTQRRAIQLTFGYRNEGQDMKSRYTWLVDQGFVYEIAFETANDDPKQLWPLMELMMGSLKILKEEEVSTN